MDMEVIQIVVQQFPSVAIAIIMLLIYRKVHVFVEDATKTKKIVNVLVEIACQDNGNAKKLLEVIKNGE